MYEELKKILHEHQRIVFFGGAGVSTESGVPDFRSQNGLYQKKTYPYPAEVMLSRDFFDAHPDQFYDFYFREMIYAHAQPNAAHTVLAQWEKKKKLQAIITQNIDGLHQLAGSKEVIELHGSVHRNHCMHCHAAYSLKDMLQQKDRIPKCSKCGCTIKPDVVLYGEGLDQQVLKKAIQAMQEADVLLVGGTSLVVYPAAGLLQYFHGSKIIVINKDTTFMDERADMTIHAPIAEVLAQVK